MAGEVSEQGSSSREPDHREPTRRRKEAPRKPKFRFNFQTAMTVLLQTVIARSGADEAIHSFFTQQDGLLRGAIIEAYSRDLLACKDG
jgi:hypothetical protein